MFPCITEEEVASFPGFTEEEVASFPGFTEEELGSLIPRLYRRGGSLDHSQAYRSEEYLLSSVKPVK